MNRPKTINLDITSRCTLACSGCDRVWYKKNNNGGTITGTYIHGIFENDIWRDQYINLIRKNKNLPKLDKKTKSYKIKREEIINNLAKEFNKHLEISSLLN